MDRKGEEELRVRETRSVSGGERRMEKTDPKTIEEPKVMIHRLFTPLCRLGD